MVLYLLRVLPIWLATSWFCGYYRSCFVLMTLFGSMFESAIHGVRWDVTELRFLIEVGRKA